MPDNVRTGKAPRRSGERLNRQGPPRAERLVARLHPRDEGCEGAWRRFADRLEPGDELWSFASATEVLEMLAGGGGVALVRKGKAVACDTSGTML
jgi:hypothetical protein